MRYAPATLPGRGAAAVVADVVLDSLRRLVWLVCPSMPSADVRVMHGDTGASLPCIHISTSPDGEVPSALLGYSFEGHDTPTTVRVLDTDVCLAGRLSPLRELLAGAEVVVTTLFDARAPDAGLRDLFEWHYRTRHGVQAFLMYDNAGDSPDDSRSIPWALPYWADGTPGAHCAQSTQLAHAALVCSLYAPPHAWLLNVDLDEYLASSVPLRAITSAAVASGYDVVGVRSVWADATLTMEETIKTGEGMRLSPFTFAWPQRSKFAQQHVALASMHRGIHAPSGGKRTLVLSPEEARLLHFAFVSGAARSQHLLLLPASKIIFQECTPCPTAGFSSRSATF